jgi:hypothetical protein
MVLMHDRMIGLPRLAPGFLETLFHETMDRLEEAGFRIALPDWSALAQA